MAENSGKLRDNSSKYIELGYNIAYYRKHKGLTQEQLAERVGISRQHLAAELEVEAYRLLMFRD